MTGSSPPYPRLAAKRRPLPPPLAPGAKAQSGMGGFASPSMCQAVRKRRPAVAAPRR
ncbi:hypothetical protein QT235_18255 [Geobacillus stearothermophilus]|nr:hypothetical protein QT235_18255 [Geobacillus stearothermophilus]